MVLRPCDAEWHDRTSGSVTSFVLSGGRAAKPPLSDRLVVTVRSGAMRTGHINMGRRRPGPTAAMTAVLAAVAVACRVLAGVACTCVLLLAWAAPSWARSAPDGVSAAASGSLSVRIVGLPAGQGALGVLRGPHGLRRSVSAAELAIPRARAGAYRLTLRAVTISRAHGNIKQGASARPVKRTTTVRVRAGHLSSLVGTYGTIINPDVKTLRGGAISVTGPPEDPTGVVLSGRQTFAPYAIISMPPSVQLPRGLLDHVTAVSYSGGNTVLSLTAASIYEVAPNFQFDVPLQEPGATAADFSAGADCGLPAGLSPYRHIKDVSFSGGWSTVDVFGVHITDGVRASVHLTVEAGLEVTAGAGLSCSLSLAFNASGMAGPIPVTAGIEGDLSGSADVGGVLKSGGSIEVSAGGHTVGFPPAMALIPDVSFDNPHFTMTAKQFAQATAGIGVAVKAGVGVGGVASLTLNVGSSLDFTAQPGSCLWNAKFGQFSAEGELLKWHLSTPQTPALFTKQLGGNFCATSGSGGGSGGGGGGSAGRSGVAVTNPGNQAATVGSPTSLQIQATDADGGTLSYQATGLPVGVSINQSSGLISGTPTSPGVSDVTVMATDATGPSADTMFTWTVTLGGGLSIVAAGYSLTCAVVTDGGVDCWGANEYGQLGDGSTTGSLTPVAVSDITRAVSVVVGYGEACALLSGGSVDCWGDGYGSTPVTVPGVTTALAISVGDSSAGALVCALMADKTVECWDAAEELAPAALTGIDNATGVAAGGDGGVCVILSNGTVDCGSPEYGLAPESGISDATAISYGFGYACALLATREIACWGSDLDGELGNGTVGEFEESFSKPVTVSGITTANEITTGWSTACALLADGNVDCWGWNLYGQLGIGTNAGPIPDCFDGSCSSTPVAVSDISHATSVSALLTQVCATLVGGAIDCWGRNGNGELGDGTTTETYVPVPVSATT